MSLDRKRQVMLLAITLLITTAIYWASLQGSFVFDDYANIVDNSAIHLAQLDAHSLRDAALSSPSATLIRPIAMLSFALDWYISPGNSRFMKVENLLIHLANGAVLFALINLLIRLTQEATPIARKYLPIAVTATWLVAPINFTAVAYIVQRMESLCNLIVLIGLYGFLNSWDRMHAKPRFVLVNAGILISATAIGCCVKESAALLPLYAFVADYCLTSARTPRQPRRHSVIVMYTVILAIPALIAGVWALSRFTNDAIWADRTFTLPERLLTEPRIILDYVKWTLFPLPGSLSLYHDDIAVSNDFLHPFTTLLSIVALGCAAIFAIFIRARKPLLAVGILWFLAAQLLTGTIIPLELAFEHRNYFASIGLFLGAFDCIFSGRTHFFVRRFAVLTFVVFFACVTALRSAEWANPVLFALSESAKNPDSPRTAYELARTYVILSRYDPKSPLISLSYAALKKADAMKSADALPDQGLLLLSAHLHQEPPPNTWRSLRQKLSDQPLSTQNVFAVYALTKCSIDEVCNFPPGEMIDTLSTTVDHHPSDTRILSIYANYAANVLNDPEFAIELSKQAVQIDPNDVQLRTNVIVLLNAEHQTDQAREFYRNTLRDLPRARQDMRMQQLAKSLGLSEKS